MSGHFEKAEGGGYGDPATTQVHATLALVEAVDRLTGLVRGEVSAQKRLDKFENASEHGQDPHVLDVLVEQLDDGSEITG